MKIFKHPLYPFVAVVLFLIIDFIQSYFYLNSNIYSIVFKGLIGVGFIINTNLKSIFKLIFFLLIIFVFAQLNIIEALSVKDITYNIKHFILYIFVLILYGNSIFYLKIISANSINKIMLVLLSIIFITIWIGVFTDSISFKTYGNRWGYKGILGKSSTLSYFIIGSLSYTYYLFTRKLISLPAFLFFLLTSLFTGTKTVYLFLIVLLLYHIYINKKYLKKTFWYATTTTILIIILNIKTVLHNTDFLWMGFYKLYLEKGFLYSLSSFRSEMLYDGAISYFNNWSMFNFLFGGRIPTLGLFEMSFFDLLSFFGLIGVFYYLKILIVLFRNSNLYFSYSFSTFVFLTYLFCSFLLGQFFISSSATLYSWFFILLIILNEQKHKHPKDHY